MFRLGKRQLHGLFYYLKLTRRLEEEMARLHREGKIRGPLTLSTGREAVGVGIAYPLRSGDFLASSIPGVGSWLVRRVQPVEVLAHFMGKAAGFSRGREGSMGLGDMEKGLVGSTGHLAAHLSVSAGIAYAAKFDDKKTVAVAVVGERAMATGDFHEGLNFAAVHRLPLVVVVENGPYASSVSSLIESRFLYEAARGYGVPSLPVDGNDILQVVQVMVTAIDRARSGKGPTLLEARTARGGAYPMREDAIPMPFKSEEAGPTSERGHGSGMGADPVAQFEAFLVDHGLLQPVERGLILDRIERLLDNQMREVEKAPWPGSVGLSEGVLQTEPNTAS